VNKQISLILLSKLGDANYLDRTSGVVQVVRKHSETDEGFKIEKRIPYSHSATLAECSTMDKAMIPNSKHKSCLYFEDKGIDTGQDVRGNVQYTSRLRLVCWLNMNIINGLYDPAVTSKIMADIIFRLMEIQNQNEDPFSRVTVKLAGIAEQSQDIFSAYDYAERETQFLMPPFDFFAIDFTVTFSISKECDRTINLVNFKC
jgi:hypothetical protein